jgi:putative ABC transport system permease protein
MLTPARIWRRLRTLLSPRRVTDELDEEMRFHLEMETARHVSAGMDEATARRAALRDFGGVPQHREEAGDALGVRAIRDFMTDIRVGARSLLRQRTYAVVATLTLAIGIGGTTALGTAVHRVLIAPYPFAHADRIVTLWQTDTKVPGSRQGVAPANYRDWEERARSFDLMAAMEPYSFDWISPDGPVTFQTALVTEDFFTIQGLRPLLGRGFLPEEFEPGRDGVVVLTEALWRARFGADTALLGRTLVLDSVSRVVVGVMPEDAMAPFDAEMWAPKLPRPEETTTRTGGYWQVVARRREDASLERAQAELSLVASQLAEEHPATNRSIGAEVVTLREAVGGSVRRSLLVLFGAVAFVMFIACVNVANLQLGEAIRRRRELAIRTAIGAGHGRLMRQLLTESLLVAAIGSAAGLFLAWAGIAAIRSFAPESLWQLARLRLDGTAVLFAAALALLAGLAIGVMPVAAARRLRLTESLAAGVRTSAGSGSRRRANRVLVVSEVALALVLLVGAGLLLRSLAELGRTERGFATAGVHITTVQAWNYYPTPEARVEFVRQVTERLAALPGVNVAGITSSLPLSWPIGRESAPIRVEGNEPAPGDSPEAARVAAVTTGYLEALEIPLQAGRLFTDADRQGSAPVVIINRTFARRHFAGADPVGRRLAFGFMGAPTTREIVGVVGDVRHDGLDADPTPGVYVPHAQAPTGAMHLVLQADGDPAAVRALMRSELAAMNGAMPLDEMTTMEALLSRSLHERRFQLGLLASFSVTALLLAAIGIYGVMSRAAAERTHEIGVRLAVGAQPHEVRWMVLRSGGALALLGVVAGTAIALLLTRYMAAMLFGVKPIDPLTYVGSAGMLLGTALLATWVPAWRASAVDPVVALRSD